MKKLLLSAFIAVGLISSAFANPDKTVNSFVLKSFEESFKNIDKVEWKITASFSKATFVLNNVKTDAFYKLDGEFIGTSHAIAIEDLPIAAKRNFAKKYGSYIVKEAIKFEGTEETAYFISAKNDKHAVILKANNIDIWVYQVNDKD